MGAAILKTGMREFRAHLPQYLLSTSPIAITRHGETIGFYIPTRHHPAKAEINALKKAALQLDSLLLSLGATEDELLKEFRSLKRLRK